MKPQAPTANLPSRATPQGVGGMKFDGWNFPGGGGGARGALS